MLPVVFFLFLFFVSLFFVYLRIKRSNKNQMRSLTVLKNSSGDSYGISPGLGANGQKLPRLAWLMSGLCILTFRQSQKNIFGIFPRCRFFYFISLFFCCCKLFFVLFFCTFEDEKQCYLCGKQ